MNYPNSYTAPDGQQIRVTYIADENGMVWFSSKSTLLFLLINSKEYSTWCVITIFLCRFPTNRLAFATTRSTSCCSRSICPTTNQPWQPRLPSFRLNSTQRFIETEWSSSSCSLFFKPMQLYNRSWWALDEFTHCYLLSTKIKLLYFRKKIEITV